MITLLLKKLDGTIESKVVDLKYKVSENFCAYEFLVNGDDNLDLACVSQYDIDTLQYMRTLYGLSIMPTSAGRTPKYNIKIGGSTESNHAHIFDVNDFIINSATNIQLDNVFNFLKLREYTGIGRYKGGRFHIDRGYRDKITVWDKR